MILCQQKKPVVQTVIEQQYYDKLKEIARINGNRKISEQTRRILEQYIENYETNNGKIVNIGRDNNGQINM